MAKADRARPPYLIRSVDGDQLCLTIAIRPPTHLKIQSDGVEDSWKNTTIAVRSNRDRGAIEPRSWILHCGIDSMIVIRCFLEDRQHDRRTIDPRSGHDHAAIEPRSRLDRVFLKRNSSRFTGDLKPQCRSMETASTTHHFCTHDRVNCPRSSGQFPL